MDQVEFKEMARHFLQASGYLEDETLKIRFWKEDFFLFKNKRYEKFAEDDLDNEINCWLAGHESEAIRFKMGTKSWLEKIKFGIRTLAQVPYWVKWPAVYDPETNTYREVKDLIAFQNGILILKDYLAGGGEQGDDRLCRLDSNFLSFNVLPYEFVPGATCPTYDKLLREIFSGSDAMIQSWHEWCGYHFLRGQKFAKFLVLCGEGANGKSVLMAILEQLVGSENCSAVSLSSFFPDSFAIGTTFEKLANICSEMSDLEKISEQTLKQYVSGDVMQANRKYQSHMEFNPTAKLTFCCNNLPTFNDKTDGIWRRVFLMQMEHQVLEEEKQRPELKEGAFWRGLGEMSGIVNYALLGLRAAVKRGYLFECSEMARAREEYRQDSNPVAQFIQDALEHDSTSAVSMQGIYDSYDDWCRQNNYRAYNMNNFCKAFWRTQKGGGSLHRVEGVFTLKKTKKGNLADGVRLKLVGPSERN
jgi:putative DNA primase/helicase